MDAVQNCDSYISVHRRKLADLIILFDSISVQQQYRS
jgi:hypothetical protein